MIKKTLLLILLITGLTANAQTKKAGIPSLQVRNLKGEKVDTGTLQKKGKPMIISFWATWCKPCIRELNAMNEVYDDWVEETGVRLVAISTDDTRTASRVPIFVSGSDWLFDVYQDLNSDFKRAMNVGNVPHTFLINPKGEIVYQHTSYAPGDEEKLYQKLLEISNQ